MKTTTKNNILRHEWHKEDNHQIKTKWLPPYLKFWKSNLMVFFFFCFLDNWDSCQTLIVTLYKYVMDFFSRYEQKKYWTIFFILQKNI